MGFGFSADANDQARISALFVARIVSCEGDAAYRAVGKAYIGWSIHIVRDNPGGCEMCSNFWLGKDIEALPEDACGPCKLTLPFADRFANLSFVKRMIVTSEEA